MAALGYWCNFKAIQATIGNKRVWRRVSPFRTSDPVDPISPRDRCDVRPQRPREEPRFSACARGELEACLEQKRI